MEVAYQAISQERFNLQVGLFLRPDVKVCVLDSAEGGLTLALGPQGKRKS